MELNTLLISLPAIIALLIKGGIYLYARYSGTHNHLTRLYLYALFALSVQNIAEIWHFYTLGRGLMPYFEVKAFYAASIAALALFFHLAMSLGVDRPRTPGARAIVGFVYMYAAALVALLITPWLIMDLEPIGYSVTRVPGPLYVLFELYVLGVAMSVIGFLAYGCRYGQSSRERARAAMVLVAILPMGLLVVSVVLLLHFGVHWFNASFTNPIAITVFLVLTAYAIHQHRIFDILFFMPWSKVRKRQTAFYTRIRKLIAEIAGLKSAQEVLDRLAEVLRCPVALISRSKVIIAPVGSAPPLHRFPRRELRGFDQIVVAREIIDSDAKRYALMARHGVAAVVPFHPDRQRISGWLLLGEPFSERVYTPLDFRIIEELFDKMATLFLDKLLAMHTRLATAHREIRELRLRADALERERVRLDQEVRELREVNARLVKERPVDSLGTLVAAADVRQPISLTYLGRDKQMLALLRRHFPAVARFVGPESPSFRRRARPEILVCSLDPADSRSGDRHLLKILDAHKGRIGVMLCGRRTTEFVSAHRETLLGNLVEVLPDGLGGPALARRIQALARLVRDTHALVQPDEPLIGRSPAFVRLMRDVADAAGFNEPVLLVYEDVGQARAVAQYLHAQSRAEGPVEILRAEGDWRARLHDTGLLAHCEGGTLMIEDFCAVPEGVQQAVLHTVDLFRVAGNRLRLVLGCRGRDAQRLPPIKAGGGRERLLRLEVQGLADRRSDIPLLAHYFTLQFNLQASAFRYLTQEEMDRLLREEPPTDVASLREGLFEALRAGRQEAAADEDPVAAGLAALRARAASLDELVGAFEARLIEQTLERCNGNKSQAARLLGLRPNTLHYKLLRHGLTRGGQAVEARGK